MERDELRNKFTEVLTVEDQAERSTMLNDMRAEVEKTYTELDNLKAENTKLIEKNTSFSLTDLFHYLKMIVSTIILYIIPN